jgi:DNA-binding transcriptional LysR family regulator
MSLDHFMVFATVAKHRSVTLASEALHITQPAVTKQLKLLEERYRAKLYTKGGKGIRLTDEGRIFLRDVRTILRQHERLKRRLDGSLLRAESRSLTVGGSYSPSVALLPSLLTRFEKRHPRVRLQLRTGNRLAIERLVLKGEVDLAVINNPPINRQLTMEPYRSEPFVAFVAAAHPLAKRKKLNWNDLRQVGFIARKQSGGRGTIRDYLRHLSNSGFRPNVIMRCDTPGAVKEAVRGKMGVGLLYKQAVADSVARREFKVIKVPGETFEGKSYIIYHKSRPIAPLAQEVRELLRQSRRKS